MTFIAPSSWTLRTKLHPPRYGKGQIPRPALVERLLACVEEPLTFVIAGAGYGKSSLLTQLHGALGARALWYTCGPEDGEPAQLLRGLIELFQFSDISLDDHLAKAAPHESPEDVESRVMALMLNRCMAMREERVLLLDDCQQIPPHRAGHRFMEHLLGHLPANLHVIYSSRTAPDFSFLPRARLHQGVHELSVRDLAFTRDEIALLAEGLPGERRDVATLEALSEGWGLGLRMLVRSLEEGAQLQALHGAGGPAFREYLRAETLMGLEEAQRDLLLRTSFLDILHPSLCDYVLEREGSASLLDGLAHSWGFLSSTEGGVYRLHQLFSSCLEEELRKEREAYRRLLHRAAEYFLRGQEPLRALEHLAAGAFFEEVCSHLEYLCEEWLSRGGHEAFLKVWRQIPREVLRAYPSLLLKAAGGLRGVNLYEPAMEAYRLAYQAVKKSGERGGIAECLLGLARIHLDSLEPFKAAEYLTEALAACPAPTAQRARALRMLAENHINRGEPDTASAYLQEAMKIEGSTADTTQARLYIRSGALERAREMLMSLEAKDTLQDRRASEAHREAPLLLSLVYSMLGDGQEAERKAQGLLESPGISPATRAVAFMRRGHGRQLPAPHLSPRQAEELACAAEQDYRQALALGEELKVERLKAEPLMGLSLLTAFTERDNDAVALAVRGKKIAWESGDMWFSHLTGIAVGVAHVSIGDLARAREAFLESLPGLERCADRLGAFICRLWLAVVAHRQGDEKDAAVHLRHIREGAFPEGAMVLQSPTLLGPRHGEDLEFLRAAPVQEAPPAEGSSAGSRTAKKTPGLLKIQAFGALRVWLQGVEVSPRQWKREKARRLLEFFIVHRRAPVARDVVLDALWPDATQQAAYRDFRVAMKALRDVIEPGRDRKSESPYLAKGDGCYGLVLSESLWLDVEEFEALVRQGHDASEPLARELEALELYRGDLLGDCLYEDWCAPERERLRALFVETASRAAGLLLEAGDLHKALFWCRQCLQAEPAYEEAYRVMMRAHHGQGQKSMVRKAFQACRSALESELGVEPSQETARLFAALSA